MLDGTVDRVECCKGSCPALVVFVVLGILFGLGLRLGDGISADGECGASEHFGDEGMGREGLLVPFEKIHCVTRWKDHVIAAAAAEDRW